MRRLSLLFTFVLSAGLSTVATDAGATTNPLAHKSAAEIVALSSAAMQKAGSVHVVNKSVLNGAATLQQTTDSARTVGVQTQLFGGGDATIRLIGTTLYLNANTTAYNQDFNIANPSLAGKWVRVPASNPNYKNISSAVLLASLVQNVFQMNFLRDLGPRTFHGVATVALKGSPPNNTPGTSQTQTVYVSTTAPYLPVGIATTFLEGVNGTGTILFSRWGETVQVKAPAGFVVATPKNFP